MTMWWVECTIRFMAISPYVLLCFPWGFNNILLLDILKSQPFSSLIHRAIDDRANEEMVDDFEDVRIDTDQVASTNKLMPSMQHCFS